MIEYENLGLANKPFFNEYIEIFEKTLNSGWYVLGKNVSEFEKEFASFHNAKYCVGLNSGLDALIFAIKAFNFPADSEIIVPSNTYIATIISIIQCGFKPVLVEPDISTYNINPSLIEQKITSKTKAIMIVHLYGKCCNMDGVMKIKSEYNLKLIEDCAQSHGARFRGKLCGTFGEIGAFSFYPTKNLGALGDAGAIITNDPDLELTIRRLRNYGSDVKYHNEIIGFNSRLQEIQAGFLSVKLKHLDEITTHKRKLAAIYHNNLDNRFIKPVVNNDYFDVYHIYNIRHPKRDELRTYLLNNGIKTDVHYPIAPHKQKAMQSFFVNESFPISEEIHSTTISLPISFANKEEEIYKVTDLLNNFNH